MFLILMKKVNKLLFLKSCEKIFTDELENISAKLDLYDKSWK